MRRPLLLLLLLAATGTLIAAACEPDDIFVGSDCMHDGEQLLDPACCPCPLPEDCPDGPKPIPAGCPNAPDAGADDSGTDGGVTCAGGTCVPLPPDDWQPVAYASTWAAEPFSCPAAAPLLAFEGSPEPPPLDCGACSCAPPEGSCAVPATWTVSSAGCDNPGGGVKTNFNPPAGWDGACNEDVSILGTKLCGGVPCVRSIVVQPPVITELPCAPVSSGDPLPPVPKYWSGPETPTGHVCKSGQPAPGCADPSEICIPGGAALAACLFKEGDHPCPAGWDDRHLLYDHVEDNRACSDCACGPPEGASCQALYNVFSGPACSPFLAGGIVTTGMLNPCHDFMLGTDVISKSAEILDYTKGSCLPSGGEVVGDLLLDKPATVCCFASVT